MHVSVAATDAQVGVRRLLSALIRCLYACVEVWMALVDIGIRVFPCASAHVREEDRDDVDVAVSESAITCLL